MLDGCDMAQFHLICCLQTPIIKMLPVLRRMKSSYDVHVNGSGMQWPTLNRIRIVVGFVQHIARLLPGAEWKLNNCTTVQYSLPWLWLVASFLVYEMWGKHQVLRRKWNK